MNKVSKNLLKPKKKQINIEMNKIKKSKNGLKKVKKNGEMLRPNKLKR
jgi:hypothetical protein